MSNTKPKGLTAVFVVIMTFAVIVSLSVMLYPPPPQGVLVPQKTGALRSYATALKEQLARPSKAHVASWKEAR